MAQILIPEGHPSPLSLICDATFSLVNLIIEVGCFYKLILIFLSVLVYYSNVVIYTLKCLGNVHEDPNSTFSLSTDSNIVSMKATPAHIIDLPDRIQC